MIIFFVHYFCQNPEHEANKSIPKVIYDIILPLHRSSRIGTPRNSQVPHVLKNSSGVGTSLLSWRIGDSKRRWSMKQIDLATNTAVVSNLQNLGQEKPYKGYHESQHQICFLNFGQMPVAVHFLHPNWHKLKATCAHEARCRNKLDWAVDPQVLSS